MAPLSLRPNTVTGLYILNPPPKINWPSLQQRSANLKINPGLDLIAFDVNVQHFCYQES